MTDREAFDDLDPSWIRERHSILREANEMLALATQAAQESQARAERAQTAQTEFLAVIAHELRSPLMPILSAASLLPRLDIAEPLLTKIHAIIERQVGHMTRLIDDLLDASRTATGKLRLHRSRLDFVEVIGNAIEMSQSAFDSRSQNFRCALPSEPIAYFGDPVRLCQVFCNLLDNASKYTPRGGDIALELRLSEEFITVQISDSGIGIAVETLPKIFELFVQDAKATQFDGSGLGIGLTVVRDLVDGHGGKVTARSAGVGRGSEFLVRLPITDL